GAVASNAIDVAPDAPGNRAGFYAANCNEHLLKVACLVVQASRHEEKLPIGKSCKESLLSSRIGPHRLCDMGSNGLLKRRKGSWGDGGWYVLRRIGRKYRVLRRCYRRAKHQ